MSSLTDVTFLIPYKKDSEERAQNLSIVKNYVYSLQTHVLVLEMNEDPFHRTKYLNKLIKMSTTPFVCLLDVDVIVKKDNIFKAVEFLKEGATLSYPYSGRFLNVPNSAKTLSIEEWEKMNLMKLSPGDNSVGGIVFAHKERYKECGWENENFIQWGEEDEERFCRVRKLGYTIKRVDGVVYHLNHPRSEKDNYGNPYFKTNVVERKKVESMTQDQLKEYIKTWQWIKQV